jgi:hypothetical protein
LNHSDGREAKVVIDQTAIDVGQVKVATQQTVAGVDQLKVVAQETATDVDQVKRLLTTSSALTTEPYASF